MNTVTAFGTSAIRLPAFNWNYIPINPEPVRAEVARLMDADFAKIKGITHIAAPWFPELAERLRKSIHPTGVVDEADGEWLSKSTAEAGIDFLNNISTALPEQPHISSSIEGDLIAEFTTPFGRLTAIVGDDFVLGLAIIDGTQEKFQARYDASNSALTARQFRQFVQKLVAGKNGAVDSQTK